MVWLPSLVFALLLVVAHVVEPELFAHPISFARDGRYPALGYAVFVSLIVAITCYGVVLLRTKHLRRFAVGPLVAAGLLVVVTLTPTMSTFHDGVAGFVLVWVTVFFAVRLLDMSPWAAGGWLAGGVVVTGGLLVVSPPWAQKVLVLAQVAMMCRDAKRVKTFTTRQL